MSDEIPRRTPLVTIVDTIASLPREDVGRLVAALRERLGVPEASPPSGFVISNPPWIFHDADWFVVLEDAGADRVAVMRLLRAHTDLSISVVKELVLSAPSTVERRFARYDADRLVAELRAAGARARTWVDPVE